MRYTETETETEKKRERECESSVYAIYVYGYYGSQWKETMRAIQEEQRDWRDKQSERLRCRDEE